MSEIAIERLEAYLRKNPYNKQAREHLDRLRKQRSGTQAYRQDMEEEATSPPRTRPPPKTPEMNQSTRYLAVAAVGVIGAVLGYAACCGHVTNPLEAARHSYGRPVPGPASGRSEVPTREAEMRDTVFRPPPETRDIRPTGPNPQPYRCWDRQEHRFVDSSFCDREPRR
jgi:hypothetical protein